MTETTIRIAQVECAGEYALHARWANGKALTVDLCAVVHGLKGLRSLRDPKVFARVSVGEGGHSVVWPDEIDLGGRPDNVPSA